MLRFDPQSSNLWTQRPQLPFPPPSSVQSDPFQLFQQMLMLDTLEHVWGSSSLPLLPAGLPTPFAVDPALASQVSQMRQGLHQGEMRADPARQLHAFMNTQIPPQYQQMMLSLLVMMLMLGAHKNRSGQSNRGTSGVQGVPNANNLGSVPGQSRDLGALNGSIPPATGHQAGDMTPQELQQLAPNLSMQRAQELAPHLNAAMREANISTREQKAAFVAQLAQESGGFKWFEELASGAAYEGRSDLGNTQPGDGMRFKGRGPVQLTGRSNYRAAGRALGLPLEQNPELVARPDIGFRVAAWYWNSRNINEPAARGDFERVTRLINGGLNGYDTRLAYYQRALSMFA